MFNAGQKETIPLAVANKYRTLNKTNICSLLLDAQRFDGKYKHFCYNKPYWSVETKIKTVTSIFQMDVAYSFHLRQFKFCVNSYFSVIHRLNSK